MKAVVVLVCFLAAVSAVPRIRKHFPIRNLYREPLPNKLLTKDVDPRITGGSEVTPHSLPYQAWYLVYFNDGGGWNCGGSLISASHVVTAAHCTSGATSATVTLGAHNVDQQEDSQVNIESSSISVHSGYDESVIRNDIAIITLSQAVELNSYIATVGLPSAGNDYANANAIASGWGYTSAGSSDLSSTLQQVALPIMSNSDCNNYWDVSDSQVCGQGSGSAGTCYGDSGGPLVYENALIGIVSFGPETCGSGYPCVFTRVSSFLDWISEHT